MASRAPLLGNRQWRHGEPTRQQDGTDYGCETAAFIFFLILMVAAVVLLALFLRSIDGWHY